MTNKPEQIGEVLDDSVLFAVTALNCEKSIIPTLKTIHSVIDDCNIHDKAEIIVVDDGSTDKTSEKIHEFCTQQPKTTVAITAIRNDSPLGMANAFVTAAQRSLSYFVIPAIGTNNMPASEFTKMLNNRKVNTVTLGYRKSLWRTRPFLKALASRLLNGLIVPLFGFRYYEVTCSYLVPRADLVDFVPKDAGHGFSVYLLAGCELRKRHFREIWIDLNNQKSQGTAKNPNPQYGMSLIKSLFLARLHAKNCLRSSVSNLN